MAKISRSQKAYNKEVDLYKYFIVDLQKKIATSGWEFKEDANEFLLNYDGDKNFKVVAEITLKKLGIENPKERFKNFVNDMPKIVKAKNKIGATVMLEANEKKATTPIKYYRAIRDSAGRFNNFKKVIGNIFDMSIIKDLDSLKRQYFKLCKKYHPDTGGTHEQFLQLKLEYEKLIKQILKDGNLNAEQQNNELVIDEAIRAIIDQIIVLEGITVEVIGKWLWVGGNTLPVYKTLKSVGLEFIKKSGVPYWVYKGTETTSRGKMSMDEIKAKYGSHKMDLKPPKKINGVKNVVINKVKLKANLKKLINALNKRPIS